jgi:tRNA-dihydrouridine synthase A
MLDVTNREFRHLMRLLTKHAILWTEMVVDETIHYGAPENLDAHLGCLDHNVESPIICQLGGNRIELAASVTRKIASYGYNQVNLNAECPSHRVTHKRSFGAALMKEIDLAVLMLEQMQTATSPSQPVSIKLRIAIDDNDDWDFLHSLICRLSTVCGQFYIHARKVYTTGLDPAQNRRVPPLNYTRVYALCEAFPHCDFWINGGIRNLAQAYAICYADCSGRGNNTDAHLTTCIPQGHGDCPCDSCRAPFGSCVTPPLTTPTNLRGCMMGRAAMDHPVQFAVVDSYFYGASSNPCPNRRVLLTQYALYLGRLYPGRCLDDDPRVTTKYPAPEVVLQRPTQCPRCGASHPKENSDTKPSTGYATNTTRLGDEQAPVPCPRFKISKHILHRSFKPTLGVFFGIPGASTAWKRTLAALTNKEEEYRNCGPGFLLRRAMGAMPDHVLDHSFEEEFTVTADTTTRNETNP